MNCFCFSLKDSFPKLYYHSPETSEAKGFFVLELVGKSLRDLWNEFGSISPITAMQIGIQMVSARIESNNRTVKILTLSVNA